MKKNWKQERWVSFELLQTSYQALACSTHPHRARRGSVPGAAVSGRTHPDCGGANEAAKPAKSATATTNLISSLSSFSLLDKSVAIDREGQRTQPKNINGAALSSFPSPEKVKGAH